MRPFDFSEPRGPEGNGAEQSAEGKGEGAELVAEEAEGKEGGRMMGGRMMDGRRMGG